MASELVQRYRRKKGIIDLGPVFLREGAKILFIRF